MKKMLGLMLIMVSFVLAGPVTYYGKLIAKNGALYSANTNDKVQLKGMSFFWDSWSEGYDFYKSNVVDSLVSKWHVEIVRVAHGTGGNLNSSWESLDNAVIQAAIDNDIYVIIDFHSHSANNEVDEAKTFFTKLMTRVGLYNDGYLGSDDDLGTYLETGGAQGPITREHIIEWMEEYGKVVPYGGDFVCNYNGDKRPPLNTGKYLAYEGFRTHTSYIGGSMSDKCYNFMDTVTFVGPDPEYSGKTKEKEYARDHFGYRFVLRDSKIIESVGIGGLLKMNLKIQNVGFANNLVSKKATVILKNGSTTLELPMNVDPTKIYSKKLKMKTGVDDNPTKMWTGSNYSDIIEDTPEFDGVNELNPVIKLPEDMQEGEWEAYMRISHYGDYKTDNNYHVIQFANDTNYFDKVTGSNYLGKFILSNSTYVDPGEFPPSSSSEIQWSSSSSSKISDEWFSSSSLALDLLDTCVTFVKGAGGYGDNCYKDGLDSMTIGKCYTLNSGRDLETTAIPKKANNSFYWREFDCGSWKGIRDSIVIARGGYVESSSSAEESSSSEEFESSSSENGESSSSAEESSSSTGEEGLRDGFNFNNNIHLTISHRSIQITGMAPNTSVTLMDLQGRTLLRKQSTKSSCELNVSHSGKYFVRLGNSIELVTVK